MHSPLHPITLVKLLQRLIFPENKPVSGFFPWIVEKFQKYCYDEVLRLAAGTNPRFDESLAISDDLGSILATRGAGE